MTSPDARPHPVVHEDAPAGPTVSRAGRSVSTGAQRPTAPAQRPPTRTAPDKRWERLYHAALGLSWIAIALPLAWWGLDYYLTPLNARLAHPGHDLFRPTGLVGNRLAVAGTAMLLGGVTMYSVRKRWARLAGVGKLRHWLSFHIWLCTLGPFLILLHTSFKVGGLVSVAFWSMIVVVASGIVGRYVYVRIPQAVSGRALEMREIESERAALLTEWADAGGPDGLLDAGPERVSGVFGAFALALRSGRAARAEARRVRRVVPEADAKRLVDLAARHRRLALGRALLGPFGRVFRYWHAVHLPLAIVMALILLVHILIAVLFGYAWT
ncbi:MAG TPA: hypothetical protein VF594_00380 [Rubricoccaceae bacterium]|jgi:hypothetical protein